MFGYSAATDQNRQIISYSHCALFADFFDIWTLAKLAHFASRAVLCDGCSGIASS
jgi:hypothetical protein